MTLMDRGIIQTADEKYFGSGCTLVTTEHNIPVAAAFTDGKQIDEETTMRVTRDALAIEKPIWLIGDSAFDILNWHDFCSRRMSCRWLRTIHATRTIHSISSTELNHESRNISRISVCGRSNWTRPTRTGHREKTQSTCVRTAVSGRDVPETAKWQRHTCSYRCAFDSSSQSRIMNREVIRAVRTWRYEIDFIPPPINIGSVRALVKRTE
jgi:hypothetical protein